MQNERAEYNQEKSIQRNVLEWDNVSAPWNIKAGKVGPMQLAFVALILRCRSAQRGKS